MNDKEILCDLFCKLLFKEGSLDEKETHDLRQYVKSFLLIREEHVPYSYLTNYIYNNNGVEDVKYTEKLIPYLMKKIKFFYPKRLVISN